MRVVTFFLGKTQNNLFCLKIYPKDSITTINLIWPHLKLQLSLLVMFAFKNDWVIGENHYFQQRIQ